MKSKEDKVACIDKLQDEAFQTLNGLLIDLDGTIYHGKNRIEGADRLINFLIENQIPYRFVTNNSSATPEEVANRLRQMDINALPEHICTSAQATADYIQQQKPGATVYMIGEDGLSKALSAAGLEVIEGKPDFVVQGIDRHLTYPKLANAVSYIRDGAVSIMTNPDLLLPSDNGLIPGAGSIGAMIQAASDVEPIIVGKPSSILMNYALSKLALQANEAWVLGDNMATDIAAGKTVGSGTILVLTGLTTADNMEKYMEAAGCKPDLVCANLDNVMTTVMKLRSMLS